MYRRNRKKLLRSAEIDYVSSNVRASISQYPDTLLNLMFTTSSTSLDYDDEEYDIENMFTTNPLSALPPRTSYCTRDLELHGWCPCVDGKGKEYFIHSTSGAISYDMPTDNIMQRLSIQRECADRLTSALKLLETLEDNDDMKKMRTEISIDLETIENACMIVSQSVGSVTITTDALARADTNLMTLENLAISKIEENKKDLWGVARGAFQPDQVSSQWSTLLDKIKQVRDNLKPVQEATRSVDDEVDDHSAWVRSLRSKLRPVSDL